MLPVEPGDRGARTRQVREVVLLHRRQDRRVASLHHRHVVLDLDRERACVQSQLVAVEILGGDVGRQVERRAQQVLALHNREVVDLLEQREV